MRREVCTSLVRHLHDFVRDVRLTEAEWGYAIEFLTRTGKICDGNRQEFILLSDTLGVSMLVDAVNHASPGSTESTVLGPFYVQNPPECPLGADIRGALSGDPLYAHDRVTSSDGRPLANAIIDVWHSDKDGYYDVQHLGETGGLAGRARLHTDEDGSYRFWSIKPAAYPIPTTARSAKCSMHKHDTLGPAHVHFMIEAPDHEKLTTHVFVDGDQYLDSDAVFGVKDSLIAIFVQHDGGAAPDGQKLDGPFFTLKYDFALQKRV